MTSKGFIADRARAVALLQERVKVARGDGPASFVIRHAKWLDVFTGCWQSGDVAAFDGVIVGVAESYDAENVVDGTGCFLVPGFIDGHVHIESSMMTPRGFVKAVLPKGTTTVIWDPHEIANVKGARGIQWALDASDGLPLDIFVMTPSCVPSTSSAMKLESSGAELQAKDIEPFVNHPRVLGLAEMMNWPGLVQGDPDVMAKLLAFQGKYRDGHCPGLGGKQLNAYGVAGIHSCHESTTNAEAREKLAKGIQVLIREGSCAKDADELLPLLDAWSSATLGYCSDDRNPLDIEESGHLDCIINKALRAGLSPVATFRAASFATARLYGLFDRGAIAPGYRADFVLVRPIAGGDNFMRGVAIERVWFGGSPSEELIGSLERSAQTNADFSSEKNLNIKNLPLRPESFKIPARQAGQLKARVIGVRPNQLVTDNLVREVLAQDGEMTLGKGTGINKISVIERHHGTGNMANALVEGLNLTSGAIATSVNHDCHNVIVTGATDDLMAKAVDELCKIDGGIVVVASDGRIETLPLPIGGLMTPEEPTKVAHRLKALKKLARDIGCQLDEPFLQISFLALPVIPSLKLTDRGLVDGVTFKVVNVEVDG